MTKKIGIVGYFGHDNAGDEAMREILQAEFSGSIAAYRGEIKKCDAYIIAGGDLVQEFSGLHMPDLWRTVRDEPCYALSMGVKPGWEKFKNEVVTYLKKFRKIYLRDQESADVLMPYVKVDGVMPDLVLLADAPKADSDFPILLNYTDRPWVNPREQFQDIMAQDEILPIALCPEFDLKYSEKLVGYQEFISTAKAAKGVIGTRLHAVVMGVIAQVPVVGIAYENKVRKFCSRYKISCFDYGVRNGKEIVKSLRKADINLTEEREKIKEAISSIKTDLNKIWGDYGE